MKEEIEQNKDFADTLSQHPGADFYINHGATSIPVVKTDEIKRAWKIEMYMDESAGLDVVDFPLGISKL